MSGVFSRREAERFNDLLEADRSSTHNDLSPLLTLTQRLNVMGSVVHADDEFAARCRTRLMAVAAVQNLDSDPAACSARGRRGYQGLRREVGAPRRTPRRLVLLSGTLAAVLGLSSMGMASGSALPGETLYSFKRSKETAELAFARSDVSRGQLHLQFARTRLSEARAIQSTGDIDSALGDADADARSAMRELGEAAVSQGSSAPLDAIDRFVGSQRQDLQAWMDKLPPGQQARVAQSLAVVDQVQERSQGLRGTLACGNGTAGAEKSDDLGLLPRGCSAAPIRSVKKSGTASKAKEGIQASANPTFTPNSDSSKSSASASPPAQLQAPSLLQTPSSAPASPSAQQTGAPQDHQVQDILEEIFKPKSQ